MKLIPLLSVTWILIPLVVSQTFSQQPAPSETPVSATSTDEIDRKHFKFRAEEAHRTELANEILKGTIPVNHIHSADSRWEKKIYAALESICSVDFKEKPLAEAMQQIAHDHAIQIVVNSIEIELGGLADSNTPISISLSDLRLRSALNVLLDPLKLTFIVRNEVLEITTFDAAGESPNREVYRLPARLAKHVGELMFVVSQTVAPLDWDTNGGQSTMTTLEGLLIISAPTATHYQVQELLSKIVEKYGVEIDEP